MSTENHSKFVKVWVWIIAIAVAGLVAVVVTGSSKDYKYSWEKFGGYASDYTPPKRAEPKSPPATPSANAMFNTSVLLFFSRKYPDMGTPPASTVEALRSFARRTCGVFYRGGSLWDILAVVASETSDVARDSMAYAIGAGVDVYCPEHTAKVRRPGRPDVARMAGRWVLTVLNTQRKSSSGADLDSCSLSMVTSAKSARCTWGASF